MVMLARAPLLPHRAGVVAVGPVDGRQEFLDARERSGTHARIVARPGPAVAY